MKIRRLEVGQMKANCYLVIDKASETCLVIDPGDDAHYITQVIADEGVTPIAIIATHGHFDHVMAALEIRLAYSIPFIMNEKDSFLLERMPQTVEHFLGTQSLPAPQIDIQLKKGATHLGPFTFEVLETPGHTPGSVSLYFPEDSALFVGDVVFSHGHVGRTDFAYAQKDELSESIKTLMSLPSDTKVYAGHDVETSIEELLSVLPIKS